MGCCSRASCQVSGIPRWKLSWERGALSIRAGWLLMTGRQDQSEKGSPSRFCGEDRDPLFSRGLVPPPSVLAVPLSTRALNGFRRLAVRIDGHLTNRPAKPNLRGNSVWPAPKKRALQAPVDPILTCIYPRHSRGFLEPQSDVDRSRLLGIQYTLMLRSMAAASCILIDLGITYRVGEREQDIAGFGWSHKS